MQIGHFMLPTRALGSEKENQMRSYSLSLMYVIFLLQQNKERNQDLPVQYSKIVLNMILRFRFKGKFSLYTEVQQSIKLQPLSHALMTSR